MKVLDGFPRALEFPGEPVQQFRMGGPGPVASEITRGCDESHSEMALPDPIHQDPKGKRIAGRREPLGQRRATGGVSGICGGRAGAEHGRNSGSDLVTRLFRIATSENTDGVGGAKESGKGALSAVEFLGDGFEVLPVLNQRFRPGIDVGKRVRGRGTSKEGGAV